MFTRTKNLRAAKDALASTEAKFSSFVSHATGGRTADTSLPLNTLSVMATQKVNDAWEAGVEKGSTFAEADPLANMSDAERRVLDVMSGEIGYRLATVATDTGLMDGDVKAIVRVFTMRGLAQFGPLVEMDGSQLRGRGYTLTDAGLELQRKARGA